MNKSGESKKTVPVAIRLLDNVIDISRFPLKHQRLHAHGTRRIGLGITGLADALIMLGLRYDDAPSLELAADIMRAICHTAYRSSISLAREKRPFLRFDKRRYLKAPFIQSLPDDIQGAIAEHSIRNSHLIAIAPTGSISLLTNNVSSGLEPVFDIQYRRRVLNEDGTSTLLEVSDYAWRLRRKHEGGGRPVAVQFVDARKLSDRSIAGAGQSATLGRQQHLQNNQCARRSVISGIQVDLQTGLRHGSEGLYHLST